MKYTIIPDIHADYSRFKWSIKSAEDSSIIFLGDLIDAGKMWQNLVIDTFSKQLKI
jgi:predicted phosphodiesterase